MAYFALQASEMSTCNAGQAQELTGSPLPYHTRSAGKAVPVLGKSTAVVGTATPAVSSFVCADSAERLQSGTKISARKCRSSGEFASVHLMQPVQRSKSEPVDPEKRQNNTVVMQKAGSQAAQYPRAPMASFAGESVWSVDGGAPDLPTRTVGMEGVQPGSQHGHAMNHYDSADVGLGPNQHLCNDTDGKCSMNSEIRLALMPLLQDLAVAVTAANQLPMGPHPRPAPLAGGEQSRDAC